MFNRLWDSILGGSSSKSPHTHNSAAAVARPFIFPAASMKFDVLSQESYSNYKQDMEEKLAFEPIDIEFDYEVPVRSKSASSNLPSAKEKSNRIAQQIKSGEKPKVKLAAEIVTPKTKLPKAVVIYVCGNSILYQQMIKEMGNDADHLGMISIGYNPRGVLGKGDFNTENAETLKKDLTEVFRYAKEKYPDLPIIIKAHSLGAGYAPEAVAEKFDDSDLKRLSMLWSGRTFSSILNVHGALKMVKSLIDHGGWNINPAEAIKKLKQKKVNVVTIDALKDPVMGEGQLTAEIHRGKIDDAEGASDDLYNKELLFYPISPFDVGVKRILESFQQTYTVDAYNNDDEIIRSYKDRIAKKMKQGVSLIQKYDQFQLKAIIEKFEIEAKSRQVEIRQNKQTTFKLQDSIKSLPPDLQDLVSFTMKAYCMGETTIKQNTHVSRLSDLENAQGITGEQFFWNKANAAVAPKQENKLSKSEEKEEEEGEGKKIGIGAHRGSGSF